MGETSMNTMDLSAAVETVIKRRRSTRRFASTPLKREILLRLIEAGIWAPSGSNWQNQRFLLIEEKSEIERLGRLRYVWPYRNADPDSPRLREKNPAGIIGMASAVIVVFSDAFENDRRNHGEYHIWQCLETQNCAAAIQNMLLMATSLKLASCWVSASADMNHTRLLSGHSWREALADFDLPEHFRIQGLVLLGEPDKTDAEGFPRGESKHGATVWQSTQRKPLEQYLIGRRQAHQPLAKGPGTLAKSWLKIASRLIRLLQVLIRHLDRSIQTIEIRHILSQRN